MKRDDIFQSTSDRGSAFKFDRQVAEVFDDMITRSIPFYLEQQAMLSEIGRTFHIPGTDIYDLGCSTATTLINLCGVIDAPGKFIGYDNAQPMLEQARQKVAEHKLTERIELRLADLNEESPALRIENASLVTLCWTLQFIRPLRRDSLIKAIHSGLQRGGALVVCEKILTNSSDMNRFFIQFYYDFKRRNGYSESEILKKREALENVLVPYRVSENYELFTRNGFDIVETFFQWFNFAGFLCLKK